MTALDAQGRPTLYLLFHPQILSDLRVLPCVLWLLLFCHPLYRALSTTQQRPWTYTLLHSRPFPWSICRHALVYNMAILLVNGCHYRASSHIQVSWVTWLKKWWIKMNDQKCMPITFPLCHGNCVPVVLSHVPMPQSSTDWYLGLTLDRWLTTHHT